MGAERGRQATAVRDSAKEVQSRSAKGHSPELRDPSPQAAGNLATARAFSRFGVHPKLSISQPGDPEEEEADRVANAVVGRTPVPAVQRKCACTGGTPCAACEEEKIHAKTASAGPAPRAAGAGRAVAAVQSGGRPLPRPLRSSMESRFARDLSSVRVHTDGEAGAAARAINARAFTVGNRIAFAPGEFRPHDREGLRLLAHELAHVAQTSSGPGTVRRKDGLGTGDPTGAKGQQVTTPQLAPAPAPADVVVPIDVEGAGVGAEHGAADDKQRIVLTVPVVPPPQPLLFYGVPVGKLRKAAATSATPPLTPAQPPAVVVPSDAEHPVGSTVTTIDGEVLKVAASTTSHVITEQYTKFAVGAASTSIVRLADGTVIIIDAGVNAKGMGTSGQALSDLTLNKIAEIVGPNTIREVLVSHAHADHTSLLPEIIRRFPVDLIRINSVQARWPGYKELRKAIVEAQQERIRKIEAAFKEGMAKERAAWEAKQESVIDDGARQARWDKHVAEEFQRQAEKIPGAKGARERVLLQTKRGVFSAAEVDVATGQKKGVPLEGESTSPAFGEEDPYLAIRETQVPSSSKRITDQRRATKDSDVDPYASAYVVTVNGVRFLVLPDIRASNMKALMDNFQKATKGLAEADVQIWDASHHMQKGWYSGAVPERQMAKIVDFLFKYRSRKGSDAVVVSAEADLRNPSAGTLVDPANIWLLRTLGFEVYLATAASDVRVYNITTAQGKKLTGVAAPRAPGTGPPHLTIARAKLALEKLSADRLIEETALTQETDQAKKDDIKKRIAELDRVKGEIETAYKECLAEIPKKFQAPDGGHTSQSLADAGKVEFPKQKVLDDLLEKYKFDRPVTSDAHLTDVALVVLGQKPPGPEPGPDVPASPDRQLAKIRSDIAEISARISAGEVGVEVRADLLIKLKQYRAILDGQLNPTDPAQKPREGTTKELLLADLKSIDAKIDSLQEATSAKTFKRVGSQLIEQHTVVLKPLPKEPSKAAKVTGEALEGAGRGMGLVMVISTVSGEGDLLKRWQQGNARNTEVAFGTAHNVIAGAVAVRMLRGLPVANEVFMVMAVLDVGAAFARDYDTDEQRNVAVVYTGVSEALNLGLMAAGGVLMAQVEFPPAMVAGFLLTLAGPTILEALHVHDLLELWLEFNPSTVIEVNQDIRKLMPKYNAIVGSIRLAKRAFDADRAVVGDREAVQNQAAKSIADLRKEAVILEDDILAAFARAYKDARTNFAGLRELDDYRATFLKLRHEAGMEEYTDSFAKAYFFAGVVQYHTFSRADVEERFKKMEQDVSLVQATADEIHTMPQWTELDDALDTLKKRIDADTTDDDYHPDVRKQDAKVSAMIDNARYRLDPRSQGTQRTESLVAAPGTPGRAAYEKELNIRERQAVWLRHQYLETSRTAWGTGTSLHLPGVDSTRAPDTLEADNLIVMLEGASKRFAAMIESSEAPPKEIVDGMFSSGEDSERYREFVKGNKTYAASLRQLETTDAILEESVLQARRTLAGQKGDTAAALTNRLEAVVQETKTSYGVRYNKRGIVYLSELDALRLRVQAGEVKNIQARLEGKTGITVLSPEELEALKNDNTFGPPGKMITPPAENRLWLVPGVSKLDANGNLANIHRVVGKGEVMTGQTHIKPFQVDASSNILVGALGPVEWADDNGRLVKRRAVIPLNDAATKFLQASTEFPTGYTIAIENLGPVKPDELPGAQQGKAQ